ncbi:MAG: hypothetical protein LBT51_00385, partial [Fusobacteriaceae bacterium]|nr:hypothetical protein [Fusobacteriaceae bacterium]
SLRVGIEPIENDKYGRILHEKGIFSKTTLKYNNAVGYANKQGGILNIHEQILIIPAYRCYVLLDNSIDSRLQLDIEDYLHNGKAEYLPYFGKNEFSCWWEKESFKEYQICEFDKDSTFTISSIFYLPDNTLKESKSDFFDIFNSEKPFAYFERLPIGFIKVEDSYQYQVEKFIYSNFQIKENADIENLYALKTDDGVKYVQLF